MFDPLAQYPDQYPIIDVTRAPFNVPRDGKTDVGPSLQLALDWSRLGFGVNRKVYLPSGTYVTNQPLDFTGCDVFGEPYREMGSTRIQAGPAFALRVDKRADGTAYGTPEDQKRRQQLVEYGGFVPGTQTGTYELPRDGGVPLAISGDQISKSQTDPPLTVEQKKRASVASGTTYVADIILDANGMAAYAAGWFGAYGQLTNVRVTNATSVNLLSVECGGVVFDRLVAIESGSHGARFVNSNGCKVRNFHVSGFGKTDPSANGILIEHGLDATMAGNPTPFVPGGGMTVSDGQIEPGYSKAAMLRLLNVASPSLIDNVYVEPNNDNDGIVLDGCYYARVSNNRIVTGNPLGRPIRLVHNASLNVITGNIPSGYAAGTDEIVVEDGCYGNAITLNLTGRTNDAVGMPVRFGAGFEPTERQHTLGQNHMVSYGTHAPTTGHWRAGDLVLNAKPASGEPVGWACTTSATGDKTGVTKPATWIPFGGSTAPVAQTPVAQAAVLYGQVTASALALNDGAVTMDQVGVVVVDEAAVALVHLTGGHDGQQVVLVPGRAMSVEAKGNIKLEPGSPTDLQAGSTLSLVRVTMPGRGSRPVWMETSRTSGKRSLLDGLGQADKVDFGTPSLEKRPDLIPDPGEMRPQPDIGTTRVR